VLVCAYMEVKNRVVQEASRERQHSLCNAAVAMFLIADGSSDPLSIPKVGCRCSPFY